MSAPGNGGPEDSSMKISGNFINIYPLKMPNIDPLAPLVVFLFEHCSTKMDSLHVEPMHSTLCPSIASLRSTSNFHGNTL